MASFRTKLFHFYFRLARPMTLGVRAMAWDMDGRLFLVRHTYVPGWHLPGGGVEVGETSEQAVVKELEEEGNIEVTGSIELLGIYLNSTVSKRDHVVLYNVPDCRQTFEPEPNREIAESGFFALDALPDGTTKATLRRVDEFRLGKSRQPYW